MLMTAAFASFAAAAGGDGKGDLKQFEGTWAVESAKKGGEDPPAGELDKVRFVFAGEKVTVRHDGKEEEGTIKINAGKKPRQIDLTVKGKTLEGIYQFEKGKLTICLVEEGQTRPTKFESPKGSRSMLMILKRGKS